MLAQWWRCLVLLTILLLPNFLSLRWHISILYSCLLYLALAHHQCLAGDWLTVFLLSYSILPRFYPSTFEFSFKPSPHFPLCHKLLPRSSHDDLPWTSCISSFHAAMGEVGDNLKKGSVDQGSRSSPSSSVKFVNTMLNHVTSSPEAGTSSNGKIHFQRAPRELGRHNVCPVLWQWSLKWLYNDFWLSLDTEWSSVIQNALELVEPLIADWERTTTHQHPSAH